MKYFFTTIFLLCANVAFSQTIKGIVQDSNTKLGIENATIYFPELHTGTYSNANGNFVINEFLNNALSVQVSKLGYKSTSILVKNTDTLIVILLEPSHLQLQEVIIATSKAKLQSENITLVERKDIKTLKTNAPASLAEALTNIAGVEQQSTGLGIGKPLIRGLSGNRIVTYAMGIRQENQQWGDEHGLGIGDVGIESVEIIKGPSSLLYGSDALGGVIYFVDERYTQNNSIVSYVQSNFLSNNRSYNNAAALKINKNKIKLNLFGAYQSATDYQLPSLQRAHNTRFNEANFKTALGHNTKNWISNLRYSYMQNNFGITEDSSITNTLDRKMILPFQKINTHCISFNNVIYAQKSNFNITVGYTNNMRKEFAESKDTAGLYMLLQTYSYNAKWNKALLHDKLNLVIGSQGMYQLNTNKGTETLIPNSTTKDLGAFAMANFEINKITLQGGLRIDYRNIISTKLIEDTIIKFNLLNKQYINPNFSLGAAYVKNNFHFRSNISNGFRSPNTFELSSNGKHEGTNRYEIGNSNMKIENAVQLDLSVDYSQEHFQFSINPFVNKISNYIYLSPTQYTIDNTLVYTFSQKNAIFYGGEMGIHYHPHFLHWLHIESNFSTVMAQDAAGKPLPLIPATRINTTLKVELHKSVKEIFINNTYKFAQNRIGDFETSTPNYSLLNAGFAMEIKTNQKPIEINFTIKNILNTNYIDHLSRLKNLGIPGARRNFAIGIRYEIGKTL